MTVDQAPAPASSDRGGPDPITLQIIHGALEAAIRDGIERTST